MAMQDRQGALDQEATHGNAYLRPRTATPAYGPQPLKPTSMAYGWRVRELSRAFLPPSPSHQQALCHELDCAYQDHAQQGSSSTSGPVMRHPFIAIIGTSGG
jgi:hypothetical protein